MPRLSPTWPSPGRCRSRMPDRWCRRRTGPGRYHTPHNRDRDTRNLEWCPLDPRPLPHHRAKHTASRQANRDLHDRRGRPDGGRHPRFSRRGRRHSVQHPDRFVQNRGSGQRRFLGTHSTRGGESKVDHPSAASGSGSITTMLDQPSSRCTSFNLAEMLISWEQVGRQSPQPTHEVPFRVKAGYSFRARSRS